MIFCPYIALSTQPRAAPIIPRAAPAFPLMNKPMEKPMEKPIIPPMIPVMHRLTNKPMNTAFSPPGGVYVIAGVVVLMRMVVVGIVLVFV